MRFQRKVRSSILRARTNCSLRLLERITCFHHVEAGSVPAESTNTARSFSGKRRAFEALNVCSIQTRATAVGQGPGLPHKEYRGRSVTCLRHQYSDFVHQLGRLFVEQENTGQHRESGPYLWGCSSPEERRTPNPRQRGFNSFLPRHLFGRSAKARKCLVCIG